MIPVEICIDSPSAAAVEQAVNAAYRGGAATIELCAAMRQALAADERVYLMGEDIGVYGGAFGVTGDLVDQFGEERVRDTPISENVIVGAAVGSAVTGMRPVAEMQFMDFVTLAWSSWCCKGPRSATCCWPPSPTTTR